MGNKESASSTAGSKSTRHLDLEEPPWQCGMCGITNEGEAAKCKVCSAEPPLLAPSPKESKRGTFFRSLSGRGGSKRSVNSNDGNGGLSSPKHSKEKMMQKKKSEPKMAAARRMRTLVINKEENHALIFIKPSVPKIDAIRDHIEEHFSEFKCHLTSEGTVTAEEIAAKGIVDKHYAALAKNAMDLDPPKRALSEKTLAEFKEAFGIDFSDDKVLTLGQFMKIAPHVTAKEIDNAWNTGKRVKFGGGIYCGRLEALEKDGSVAPTHRPLLVINGFYAAMRNDYLTKGNQVLYFTVEWKEKDLSWKDFRALAVGATDPAKADPNSLRGKMLKHWKELGLKEAPSIQNNCVHASAGPIEAMRERATWIEMPLEKDPFAQAMLNEGVPLELIQTWSENAIVTVGDKTGPSFDLFEDMDSGAVIRMALRASVMNGGDATPRTSDLTKSRKKPSDSIASNVVEITDLDSPRLLASSVISERDEQAAE